ncbi:MAG: ATP-binding protein [Elusimicrobiota bacterium]|nr:ATP-binding protein [Elusimicrobiota bacterium]
MASEAMKSGLVKVISGMRRCGKSTLAHSLMRGRRYGYMNFDDERLSGVKTADLNNLLEILAQINPGMGYILLDEIQNVTGWELFVNRIHRKGYNVVVTGSNSKLLGRELATHLVGRYLKIELSPFSFREYLDYQGIIPEEADFFITERKAALKRHFEAYLSGGGLPGTFGLVAWKSYLRELFDKIITRDIVDRYGVRNVSDLKEIGLYALSNYSSRITFHKIRDIFDIKSVNTVKSYLDHLEEAYLTFQLKPFSFKTKELLKLPRKIYAMDNGLISAVVPKVTLDYGRMLENLVFTQLRRLGEEIYCYAGRGCEVDFVLREGAGIKKMVQVCYSMSNKDTAQREIGALLKASSDLRCKDLSIITWDEEGVEKNSAKTIRLVPVWKWLLDCEKEALDAPGS